MKRSSDPQKLEFWNRHLAGLKGHNGSVRAYCGEHGLNYDNFKYWQRRIMHLQPKGSGEKKSSFLPVVIAKTADVNRIRQKRLPDAKWLAEVLFEISERCS